MERVTPRSSFAHYGDNADWFIAIGTHRDADALTRSNFRVIRDDLSERFPDDVMVESFSHFLVGWTEAVLVRPDSDAYRVAEEWESKLADYPVADEEDWSREESDESLGSITEFVRCELRFIDPSHAEDVAGFICSADWPETIGMDYGIGWPDLTQADYRARVAQGLRAWRAWRREHKGDAA